jgi:iron complex outermembrane receptor protein
MLSLVPLGAQEEEAAKKESKASEHVLPGAEVTAKREIVNEVTQEQMEERGSTTLMEAIRWIPGVTTSGGHPGYGNNGISLRGVGGGEIGAEFTTIIVDGVPMSGGGFSGQDRIDYDAILTGGLESLRLYKGYSSVLWGPNNITGIINLRTAKPKKSFELALKTGFDFDGGGFAGTTDSISTGTRLGMFYAKGGFNIKYVDHWRLPESFEPLPNGDPLNGGDPQRSGNRMWSDYTSWGANAMVGATPLDTLDVWATYNFSTKYKGWNYGRTVSGFSNTAYYNPTGPTQPPIVQLITYAYPYNNRHSAGLNAEWTPGALNVGFHANFDTFDKQKNTPYWENTDRSESNKWVSGGGRIDRIWAILDDSYSVTDTTGHELGIKLDGGYKINDWNKIDTSLQFKQSTYEEYMGSGLREKPEHTGTYKTKSYADNIYFAGVEYTINPIKRFTTVAGIGLDMLHPQKLDRWGSPLPTYNNAVPDHALLKSDVSPFNAMPQWTVGLFYDFTEQHTFHLTYAKKNRFPSFMERVSAEGNDPDPSRASEPVNTSGQNLTKPNMDLKTLQTHHIEIGYQGTFLDSININAAIYTNYELNKLITVVFEQRDENGYDRQYQNENESLYYGFEFGTEMILNNYLTLGGSLALIEAQWLNYYVVTPPEYPTWYFITYIPEFTANGYISIAPLGNKKLGVIENIKIIPSFEYVAAKKYDNGRWDSSRVMVPVDGQPPQDIRWFEDYTLVHVGIFATIAKNYSVSASVHNLFDVLYDTDISMPAPGRSFNVSFGAKF